MVMLCVWSVALVMAIGCGAPSRTSPDAEVGPDAHDVGDGMVDGSEVGLVSVTVNSPVDLTVLENATVVFIQPDTTTIRTTTDAQGKASAAVSAGSSVTVFFEETRGIATILDVKPGDQLVFGNGRIIRGSTLDLTFTAFNGDADFYRLYAPCIGAMRTVTPGTTHLSLDLCFGPITSTEVLVVAYKNNIPIASAAALGVDLTTGVVTVPDAWTATANLVLDYSNVPQFENLSGDYVDAPVNFIAGGNVNGPSYDLTVAVPANAQSAYVRTTVARNSRGSQQILETLPPGTTSYQLNIAAAEQPWMSQVSYTPATRTVAVQASGQTFDAVEYFLSFGFVSNPIQWSVFSPDIAGIVLPVLPADLDPTASGAEFLGVGVTTFEVPMLAGWDVVRPQIYPIARPTFTPTLPFGRLHYQSLRDE